VKWFIETLPPKIKEGDIIDVVLDNGQWAISHKKATYPINNTPGNRTLGRSTYKAVVLEGGYLNIIRYSDLHRHSDYSLLDGMTTVETMAAKTEYSGALTDHGNMFGFVAYYKAMTALGKKPILGFEAYLQDIDGELVSAHMVLLAKNEIGLKNIIKLTSESYNHIYYKPHVTWDVLREHKEGVIATSGCVGGLIPQAILKGDLDRAEYIMKTFQSMFGEDFYVELQRHGIKDEERAMPIMVEMAKKLGVKVIATTDSHYPEIGDADVHEIQLCMGTKKTLDDESHFKFEGTGYHLHSSEEMEELFGDMPETLDNTLEVADKCNLKLDFGNYTLPQYDVPDGYDSIDEYFKFLCNKGFKDRFEGTPHLCDEVYQTRFDYELNMIEQMGYIAYFIIVWDFINYARENNVYVGPGRGSAAGSLVAYCLGITDLDPIRYNLLFERFLNPERVSMPDIDTDFEHEGRGMVIKYLSKKYGAENTCGIVTFGTLSARMVVRDVVRVLGYPVSFGDKLAKMIPDIVGMTLHSALDENPELQTRYEAEDDVRRVFDIAMKLEGCKRQAGKHACGYAVAPSKIQNYMPTFIDKEGDLAAQVVMGEVEDLGIIKMDFLGLKNLSAIHETIDLVEETRGIKMKYQDIPLDDRDTFRMLRDGNTGGVFQFESDGMKDVLSRMLADIDDLSEERLKSGECYERLIAAVSLYRPGPMAYIDDYIDGMRDRENIHYDCQEAESILASTYGVIVYQEQVIQIVQKLAGFSAGRADEVRRAMG
jgi:DNA-directed DNA polymerase III (polc)